MTRFRRATLLATAIALTPTVLYAKAGTPATAPLPAAANVAPPINTANGDAASEEARLTALFKQSDEASLKRNPLNAIFRGDLRYADRLGDMIGDTYFAAEKAAGAQDLRNLAAIDRARLTPTGQLAYDVFRFQTEEALKNYQPEILALTKVRPMNHFYGFHVFYPTFSSGTGAAPFKTVTDYDNGLKRHAEFATLIDRAIGRFREGKAAGVVETKMTVANMIAQLDAQLVQPVDQSSYWGPIKAMPATFAPADRNRLTASYRNAIATGIYPALERLRSFLKTEYLPAARDSYGLLHMKGGPALYQHLIDQTLTIHMTPDDVHATGLREVARIHANMDSVRREVGFSGTLAQFFDHLRTDPKLKMPTRQALTDGYYRIGKAVDAKLPEYFSTVPKTALEIRPYEPFREKYEAGGSYESGTPDASRPGVFYFNAYNLPERTTPGMTSLYLHEGAPGHHFQISLAQENAALPEFMRFGGNTAFVEGWALYAETLGYPMGLYRDPYQRMGTLSDEMLRAMRLVVDTGIHAKGWSRDQAIAYMMANSDMGKTDATAEVERYIAIPAQALAYKIGALTIQRLRAKAETELGPRFDIKDFHAQVLMTGALPLKILEQKIDRWIAATKAR